jgi:UDP-N-acetylmuramoyl-L-alanyl-D-glutamate--2,6-diaminopimelate ligase
LHFTNKRSMGLRFDSVGFTSFSQDHLDYHGNLANYFKAKTILFQELLNGEGFVHKNINFNGFKTYALSSQPVFKSGKMVFSETINDASYNFEVSTLGQHFAENTLLAATLCKRYFPLHSHIKLEKAVPGRMEIISPQIIVDYAHTPDALEKALISMRPYCKGRIIVVLVAEVIATEQKERLWEKSLLITPIF